MCLQIMHISMALGGMKLDGVTSYRMCGSLQLDWPITTTERANRANQADKQTNDCLPEN